ncbi:peptidoglycan bridge formation glycyltransferase FemA/FemB family protein [Cellulomonas sp. PhB143]|uniref:lipid II:glycine glycyltransferase FemX n=1 Tax=Cellulomonas sp. PhB143 TaxID=2485186 RepID=UPI001F3E91A3|nr:peptidoglycan bridge formation glycyltransferase FemA/FemB family protein [Cellulomonas sp. PhB143]
MPTQTLTTQTVTDRQAWDADVLALGGHPLQLWAWGEVKASGAWTPHRVRVLDEAGDVVGLAQVLERRLPLPFKALSHVPRGPVLADGADRSAVLQAVTAWCRRTVRGIGVTFEPDWPQDTDFDLPGWRPSPNPIFFGTTLQLDLRPDEDTLLAGMSQSTRRYVRKSSKGQIEFREITSAEEIDACLAIQREVAERAEFGIHHDDYYRLIKSEYGDRSPVLGAFEDGQLTAFLWYATSDRLAFMLYGGTNDASRESRANFGLTWYAIRRFKEQGIEVLDFNGLLNDGISRFKRSFGQRDDHLVGSIDVAFGPTWAAWHRMLPTAKTVLRKVKGTH